MGPDPKTVRRTFGRAADSYDTHAVLQREVASRLLARLDDTDIDPAVVVDLGCGTGEQARLLSDRYRHAGVLALDAALPMLAIAAGRRGRWRKRFHPVAADGHALPLAGGSADLVYSSLMAQWSPDPPGLLAELRRVLRPGGILVLSTFGPDTLRELRRAWTAADEQTHVGDFQDVEVLGDALVRAGFEQPVLDTDWITTTYAHPRDLLRELKNLGATHADPARRRGLTAPQRMRAMLEAYEAFRQPDGRYPATWEVVYATAWGAPEGRPVRTAGGEEASFSVESLRRRQ